jgi:hypothetical protein
VLAFGLYTEAIAVLDVTSRLLDESAAGKGGFPRNQAICAGLSRLGPIAVGVLNAADPYVERFFSAIPESKLLLERIDDLRKRTLEVDAAHEKLINAVDTLMMPAARCEVFPKNPKKAGRRTRKSFGMRTLDENVSAELSTTEFKG